MPLSYENIPISGNEGIVKAVIKGRVIEVASLKTITANIALNKVEYKALGIKATLHKAGAWTGTGSATYHWISGRFVKMIINAAKSGKLEYFTIVISNNDPANTIAGEQTIKLGQVSLNGGDIAKIDIDNVALEGTFDFTFSEVDGLNYFDEEEYI